MFSEMDPAFCVGQSVIGFKLTVASFVAIASYVDIIVTLLY